MKYKISELSSGIEKVLSLACILIFAITLTLLGIQVVGRYVFSWSPVWASEGALIFFIWLCFMAFPLAMCRGQHVSLEYLLSRLPAGVRVIAKAVSIGAQLLVSLIVIWGGVELIGRLSSATTPGIEISLSWLYAAPVVSGALMFALGLDAMFGLFGDVNKVHENTGVEQ